MCQDSVAYRVAVSEATERPGLHADDGHARVSSRTRTSDYGRPPPRRGEAIFTTVALLYYKDGLTQSEIAKRLGVSRASVVNYLRQAHEQNIVEIRIDGISYSSSNLSRRLREAYGLEDVYVSTTYTGPEVKPAALAGEVLRQVARVGAMALYDLVRPGDVVGVTWGETIQRLSEEVPRGAVKNLTICQVIGSMKSPLLPAAETAVLRIASALGADCHILHAPAILSNPDIAEALKREPIIRVQLDKLKELTKTLFSVGDVRDSTLIVRSGIMSAQEMRWYRNHGAVGVICGRFIDAKGEHVEGQMDARMIGITPAELKRVRNGILVATGAEKLAAMKAALVGGYVKYLVTDEATGTQLLTMAEH